MKSFETVGNRKDVYTETEEYTVLETVTRQPLVKAQQTDKILYVL
jgi:hypothetical protein